MEVAEPKRSFKDEKRAECNGAEEEGGEAGKVNLSLWKSWVVGIQLSPCFHAGIIRWLAIFLSFMLFHELLWFFCFFCSWSVWMRRKGGEEKPVHSSNM